VSGLTGDAEFDHELLAGLALSIGASVVWWLDLDDDRLGWMPGLDVVIGVPGADSGTVRAALAGLVAPLTVAARSAPAWNCSSSMFACATTVRPRSKAKTARKRYTSVGTAAKAT
jgi:hypothetical protein